MNIPPRESPSLHRLRPWLLFLAVAALVAGIYWPGLYGGYVFDDTPFLLENTYVKVTTLRFSDWVLAATSFPADHQGRWLTMLSLAANHYLTGLDPFWFKLTNLGIHLLNGLLLLQALRALFDLWCFYQPQNSASIHHFNWAALAITAVWLLLPINLTAVLYVVQRLESLSTTFVFLGLWWYLRARLRLALEGKGIGRMAAALVVSTSVGLLAKESAVLLPLYAACVELSLFRSSAYAAQRRKVLGLYATLLLVPLIGGLIWISTWVGTETSYARPFDTWERLMTQARVWVHYIGWTLLPTPDALTLYHDDLQISRGLLAPSQTLAAMLALLALLGSAIWQSARRPLFCLGILWFFSGHLLTGTIIPLEMVFEHRNYFPSCGLLLAIASLLYLEPMVVMRTRTVGAVLCAFVLFYGFTTHLRAREWSNPVRLAFSETGKRPDSPRAQMELARILILGAEGQDDDSPLLRQARASMERCMALKNSHTVCETGLILLAARAGQPASPKLWAAMTQKLKDQTPSVGDSASLNLLVKCHQERACPDQRAELAAAMDAAMGHPNTDFLMTSVHARYAAFVLGDQALAEKSLREVIRQRPGLRGAHVNLTGYLIKTGKYVEAEQQLGELTKLNFAGSLDSQIAELRKQLEQERGSSAVSRASINQ